MLDDLGVTIQHFFHASVLLAHLQGEVQSGAFRADFGGQAAQAFRVHVKVGGPKTPQNEVNLSGFHATLDLIGMHKTVGSVGALGAPVVLEAGQHSSRSFEGVGHFAFGKARVGIDSGQGE